MPRRFDFISPGIQLTEVDLSQVPSTPPKDGLLLIGRARKGPAMKPIKVDNLQNFIDVFGNPMDGVRKEDPWRNGFTGAPNYAAYAAQAYLAAGVGPVKYIRLLGQSYNGGAVAADKSGWNMGSTITNSLATNKSALGLFIQPSGTAGSELTGALAAIIYVNDAGVGLSGKITDNEYGSATAKTLGFSQVGMYNGDSDFGFTLHIDSATSAQRVTASINFNPQSENYIRKRLNTDPTMLLNTSNYDSAGANVPYFLGETFDVAVSQLKDAAGNAIGAAGTAIGYIMQLKNGTFTLDDFQTQLSASQSGWFISTMARSQKRLFRLTALDEGEEFQNNYYTKISNIKPPTALQPDGAFSLSIVNRGGQMSNDGNGYSETYDNLNLNPDSVNFIAKRIGDMSLTWNPNTKKFDIGGLYPNISDLVRVSVAGGTSGTDIPVGFVGPKKVVKEMKTNFTRMNDAATEANGWMTGLNKIPSPYNAAQTCWGWSDVATGRLASTASFNWPTFGMTSYSSSFGGSDYGPSAVFGLRHARTVDTTHDKSLQDIARGRANWARHISATDAIHTGSVDFVFTLEDIRSSSVGNQNTWYWASGSYNRECNGLKHTIVGRPYAKKYSLTGSSGLITNKKIKQFACPFWGGADGVDVRYADPFNNKRLSSGNATCYERYTLDQAIEMVADPDNIKYELISVPGLIHNSTTDNLIRVCEDRGDAMAIIDVDGIYRPHFDMENTAQEASINTVTETLNTRRLDTSYAATYFPNVRMRDTLNGNGTILRAPPSVAGIGAIAQSERVSQPWFAPAGFNRGGLGRLGGSQGPVVVGSILHLTKDDRDDLYAAHINPIARFPSTGDVVVFGQRTLQQEASALDRINVRRLMIYLKRQIGIIADTILFDQNVTATWARFKSRADKVLSSVKAELGITEYKLVLDSTTTTPDLVDRNILYAKIFVKPARSIEFIAVDFIITRSGVEF